MSGTWHATELQSEPVDNDTHYTRWDLLDEIPDMVPMRDSVRCPFHEENVDLIYESGCRFGYCGIESADDAMLKRMQKGCRQEEIYRGITLANQRGIQAFQPSL